MNALFGATTAAFLIRTADVTTQAAGNTFDFLSPIVSTGIVGIVLLMILFRIKIMPTYVHDEAKIEWERERERMQADLDEVKKSLAAAHAVYTEQVIPTLTRVLDNERELLEIRRNQTRRSD